MEMKEAVPEPRNDFHGILRYRRESEWGKINLPPSVSDHTVWCEFCGAKAKPLLDFSTSPDPKDFCCTQHLESYKKVEQQWRLLQEHAGETSLDHESNGDKMNEHRELHKVVEESLKKAKKLSPENLYEMPGCKMASSGLFTTINFRLSEFVRLRKNGCFAAKHDGGKEEKHEQLKFGSIDTSIPPGFGFCHNQGHIQKFYSNGNKFLTILPDGTTRVFYPSGNLAIIIFVDDRVGVCTILDDIRQLCPIRAFFQTSGIATCYHSSGSLWMHMDIWGGRSLNENRSRERKWKWTDYTNKPTVFKPLHISLNKNIGVRVRGRESILVTFLASGQQAHFNLGSITQARETAPSVCKEEIMLKVSQLKARLALERMSWCLSSYQDTRHQVPRLSRVLVSQAWRLLKLSSSMSIEERDMAYIQQCLQGCQ